MKKKRVLIISVIVLLFIVGVVFVEIKINTKNKELNELQVSIGEIMRTIENDIEAYNSNREIISTKLEDYYTDKLEDDYEEFISILKEQESIIINIKDKTEKLGKTCGDRLYPKGDINKICNSYQDYYETVANVFVGDCTDINNIINSYNNATDKGLEVYKAKEVLEYVDYNKDGKYLGRD